MPLSDDEFVAEWHKAGSSPKVMSENTGLEVASVYSRRRRLAQRGIVLASVPKAGSAIQNRVTEWGANHTHFVRRRLFNVKNGTVVVFSDAHWLPDHATTGQDALEKVISELKPQLVVCGGDILDGGGISRHPVVRGHHKGFSLREELDCCVEHFTAIEKVAKNAQLAWTLGNHDARLSRYVAMQAEHMLDLPFTRLEDWFPKWPLSWTVEVNPSTAGMTVIRHRNQPGMLHLQATKAGTNYVHGHLHKLNIHRAPSFRGTVYSVDCGSLADPDSDAFDYMEGNPNHAQGFAVLTFKDSRLLPPELCEVVDGVAYFRGQAL